MAHTKHPYAGPTFTTISDATLAVTTTPAHLAASFQHSWIYISAINGTASVAMGHDSTAAVASNLPVPSTPLYVPVHDAADLWFVGSGNATVTFQGYS